MENRMGGMVGGIPVLVWALCPAAWVTFGTSLTPALDCSSTMNGWVKKSRVIPNSGKHVMSRKKPFPHLPHFRSLAGVFRLSGLEVNFQFWAGGVPSGCLSAGYIGGRNHWGPGSHVKLEGLCLVFAGPRDGFSYREVENGIKQKHSDLPIPISPIPPVFIMGNFKPT